MTTTAVRPAPFRRARTVVRWVLRVALAAVFLAAGLGKLAGDPAQVEMFAAIGAGQELRYLVGGLEVAGAVGLFVPRLRSAAALGLAALMVGATVANVGVLHVSPALTIGFAVAAVALAVLDRGEPTATPAPARATPARRRG